MGKYFYIITNARSIQVGLCSVRTFFLSFFLPFFSFSIGIFLERTNDSQDNREGKENPYFSCFLLPPADKHSLSSARFLPLLFNRSIFNYQIDSWWDLFSLVICILFAFSLMQLSRMQLMSMRYWHYKLTLWGFELISNYRPSITRQAH